MAASPNRWDYLISLVTVQQVLGLSRIETNELIETGQLAAFMLGTKHLVRGRDLTLFIANLMRVVVVEADGA